MTKVTSLEEFKERRKARGTPAAGTAEVSVAAEQPPGLDVEALKARYEEAKRRMAEDRARANKRVLRDYQLDPK